MLQTIDDYIREKLVHSIHTSERRSFRGCRRRWDWIFHDGYYPVTTPKPLEFGVAYHAAQEKLYDPLTWDDRETAAALAIATFVKVCDEQFDAYQKAVKSGKVNTFVDFDVAKQDYEERKELGVGMLRHYIKNEMPKHDTNFRPVKVEIEFEVAIRGPRGELLWCKCGRCWKRYVQFMWSDGTFNIGNMIEPNSVVLESFEAYQDYSNPAITWTWEKVHQLLWKGLPVTYGGRIDMLAQDNLGRFWVYDWKSTARMTSGEPGDDDDFMWLDDQVTSYAWAMWSMGFPIAGFVYVELKKVAPEEPEPLKRPYKGRVYSTSKSAVTSTYDQYLSTVSENDPTAYLNGLYDEFLEHLKTQRFHVRHQIPRSEEELRNIGFNIWQEASDMVNPELRIYPSAGRFTCSGCAFKDPCMMKNRDEDYQYTLDTLFDKRERHYFEQPSSTDKPGRG